MAPLLGSSATSALSASGICASSAGPSAFSCTTYTTSPRARISAGGLGLGPERELDASRRLAQDMPAHSMCASARALDEDAAPASRPPIMTMAGCRMPTLPYSSSSTSRASGFSVPVSSTLLVAPRQPWRRVVVDQPDAQRAIGRLLQAAVDGGVDLVAGVLRRAPKRLRISSRTISATYGASTSASARCAFALTTSCEAASACGRVDVAELAHAAQHVAAPFGGARRIA